MGEELLRETRLTLDYHCWLRRPGRRLLWENQSRGHHREAGEESSRGQTYQQGTRREGSDRA